MKQAWLRQARALKFKINSAWVLSRALPWSIAFGFVYLLALITLKKHFSTVFQAHQNNIHYTAIFLFIIINFILFWRAKKSFYSLESTIEKLDAQLGLNCQLIHAYTNDSHYPALPDSLESGISFHKHHLLSIALLPLLVIAAIFIPVNITTASTPVQEPSAWQQIDEELKELENNDDLQQEEIAKLREKLQDLQEQDKEKWFEHSSLEASQNLKSELRQQKQNFEKQLQQSSKALEKMQEAQELWQELQKTEKVSPELKKKIAQNWDKLREQWSDEYKDLLNERLQLNKDLLKNLKEMGEMSLDQEGLKKLMADQERILKRLQKLDGDKEEGEGQPCPSCNGTGYDCGECNGTGKKPGSGGLGRGPGDGGDPVGQSETDKLNDKIEALLGRQKPDSMPGQLLMMQEGEHEIDEKSFTGPSATQGSRHKGEGGGAVWQNDLLPDEQEFLKRYYK